MEKHRCGWCVGDPLYERYHDEEWGVPLYDDNKLFEFLILETFQAGLSWITVLRKRENFRKAFDNFDYKKIANYKQSKIDALLQDAGISQDPKIPVPDKYQRVIFVVSLKIAMPPAKQPSRQVFFRVTPVNSIVPRQ